MYAISHAATALLLKKRWPDVPLWPLLIGAQAIELLWIVLTLFGVEHFSVHQGRISLDFLPYSHSVTSALLLAVVVAAALRTAVPRRDLALAAGLAIFSHVVLDVAHHQPDILLLPASVGPRLGTGLIDRPLLNLAVELAYGVACWWIYRGRAGLLIGIVVFNVLNIPTMWQLPSVTTLVVQHPVALPLLIGAQIAVTWVFVARAARPR
jgi:hypothetical protein